MPATTVELGFVTNVGDNNRFENFFNQYVDAVYNGIIEASGFKPIDNYTYTANKTMMIIFFCADEIVGRINQSCFIHKRDSRTCCGKFNGKKA